MKHIAFITVLVMVSDKSPSLTGTFRKAPSFSYGDG